MNMEGNSMHKIVCISLLFFSSLAFSAGVKNQWKSSDESLNSLVKKGFNVVSVIRLPDKSDVEHSQWEEVFFLQKSGSFFKCFENHYTTIKTNEHEADYICLELVEVYSSKK